MSIGRSDYEERREARIDRLEDRAAAARTESTAAWRTAAGILDNIPAGQPVLVGHHSEAHHRRDLARVDRAIERSIDADKKADHYAARAESARANRAISSDDPDAVAKLEAKLAALQAEHEHSKALNAWYRKRGTMKGFPGMEDARAAAIDAELAQADANPYAPKGCRHPPVPAYHLSNETAEIKRLKDRIAALRQVDEMEHVEIPFDGGTIRTNEEINRVQVISDAKPDEATRAALKSSGFRWSPREQAWQAQRTPVYLRRAKSIFGIQDAPAPVPEDEPVEPAPVPDPVFTDVMQFLFS